VDNESDSDSENDEETDEHYLQKFDIDINKNYLVDVHPECLHHNYDEIETLTVIIRDSNNIIIDPLHKTIPFLTKYERARILGQRAKQINMGAQSFIKIPDNVIDGIIIAELELKQKKIPFIIKRPLPNGACEYWNVNDLENILY
jgi:DNA-directed RNA polymerase I, II, and III subunit RPABC2